MSAFLLVWLTINALQLFDEVYVTTKGGPLHSTTVVVYYLYQQAFQFFHAGYAAAIASVLFVVIAAITLVQLGSRVIPPRPGSVPDGRARRRTTGTGPDTDASVTATAACAVALAPGAGAGGPADGCCPCCGCW